MLTVSYARADSRRWPRAPRPDVVPRFNAAYLNLNQNYLFAEIRRRTKVFADGPSRRPPDRSRGRRRDQPLPPAVVRAMHEATDELARRETFKGYGPYVGYEFLRADIATHDFGSRGVHHRDTQSGARSPGRFALSSSCRHAQRHLVDGDLDAARSDSRAWRCPRAGIRSRRTGRSP